MNARALAGLIAMSLFSCGGEQFETLDEPQEVASHPPRNLYKLQHAPYASARPTALVHLAKGFRAEGPLNLVVHFHGWSNCIHNDVEAGTGIACTPGGAVRTPHNLIGQIDASGANAALVAVEVLYDQASSADGKLDQAGFFREMILELLPHIGALAGRSYAESDLGKIALTSHSGGYLAVGDVLEKGGLTPKISAVLLFDSLYGSVAQYEAWVRGALGARRFAVVYTDGGGTKANSQSFATRAAGWLDAAGLPRSLLLDERSARNLSEEMRDRPLYFYKSALSHSGVELYWYGRLLAHAQLH